MALFKKTREADSKLKKAKTKQKPITAKAAAYDFINASKEFEISRIGEIEQSKILAWRVAIGACVLAVCTVVAIMLMMPLKEIRPYVIRVDNNTGQTDIVTMLDNRKEEYGDAVAKYFSSLYVRLVEGYDWYTIQTQVDQAMMFSDNTMQQRLQNKFAKPDAPHKVYKEGSRININVTNASIIDEKGLIQVRFTKTIEPVNGGIYDPQTQTMSPKPEVSNHIATIGYEYVNVPTLDDVRLVNPLGFTVKTYRVDDVVGE